MPEGARCRTAHEAEDRIMPNGATGAQGQSGATAMQRQRQRNGADRRHSLRPARAGRSSGSTAHEPCAALPLGRAFQDSVSYSDGFG